jgi:hypothetical protein
MLFQEIIDNLTEHSNLDIESLDLFLFDHFEKLNIRNLIHADSRILLNSVSYELKPEVFSPIIDDLKDSFINWIDSFDHLRLSRLFHSFETDCKKGYMSW